MADVHSERINLPPGAHFLLQIIYSISPIQELTIPAEKRRLARLVSDIHELPQVLIRGHIYTTSNIAAAALIAVLSRNRRGPVGLDKVKLSLPRRGFEQLKKGGSLKPDTATRRLVFINSDTSQKGQHMGLISLEFRHIAKLTLVALRHTPIYGCCFNCKSFQGQQLKAHTNLLLCSLIHNPALNVFNLSQWASTCPLKGKIKQAFNVPKSFDASFNSFNIDPNHDTRPLLRPPLQFIQARYFIKLTDLPLFEHTFIKSTPKLSWFGTIVSDTFTL
ncbi:hypothetical protein B0H16DRAFT_1465635 [Mycena metata]|uniref:Uncharacterized protein n=1 Tax=Mycena metata TaxID=1033252 RepID=A0AAD7IAL0_9AGAR|nr:hypothetical protein B0H16DRAFT_1465635 [Mycena metata]